MKKNFWKELFGKAGNIGGQFTTALKFWKILAQIWTAIKELLKRVKQLVEWVKQILAQLDRIEAKLDRVLECVDVDAPKPRAKR